MVATDTENTTNDIMASDENTDTVAEIAGAETANEAVNELSLIHISEPTRPY